MPIDLPSIRAVVIASVIGSLIAISPRARGEDTLVVYTALEQEHLEPYAQSFNEKHPEVRISWVRESTGVITSRLLEERNARQADVIWGLAATSLLLLDAEGLLEAYAPAGLDKLDPRFRDPANPPHWVGMDAWVSGLCVNAIESKGLKLPIPKAWRDLTSVVYKGRIAMPDPSTSGTGFMAVSSWLQMFGEEDGWAFMDALHSNIAHYTHSGSQPCVEAARGELAMGISFAHRVATFKARGAPVDLVLPVEGVGWELEAAAIVKGTPKLAAARTLIDWAVSESAVQMYGQNYAVLAIPALAKPIKYFPDNIGESMIDNNFRWAAEHRARIIAEWQRRYGAKSKPKPAAEPRRVRVRRPPL